ncbi:MAG TPA: hypothetical protein VGI20_14865 [Rhizomicrobium sp.]
MKSTLLLSTAICLGAALALSTTAIAATKSTNSVGVRVTQHNPVTPTTKIKGTVLNSGYYGAYGSGATLLDSKTVNCATRTTCTFALSAMIQDCNFAGVVNDIAIQATVDGNYVDGGPYAGTTYNFCVVTNWQGVYGGLASGAHTVDFYAYNSGSDDIAQWSDRVDSGKP